MKSYKNEKSPVPRNKTLFLFFYTGKLVHTNDGFFVSGKAAFDFLSDAY